MKETIKLTSIHFMIQYPVSIFIILFKKSVSHRAILFFQLVSYSSFPWYLTFMLFSKLFVKNDMYLDSNRKLMIELLMLRWLKDS